ncbi:MAG: diguanylate cyclase domain-containing protein [Acholeplasmataceae bacterium]
MKKYMFIKPYALLILIVFTLISITFIGLGTSGHIRIDATKPLNEGWTYDEQSIYLPAELDIEKDQSYQVSKVLSNDFERTQTLMVRTSLQHIIVYLDDQIIYQKNFQASGQLPPMASMWHFIELPAQSQGKVLTIELSSPYLAMSGIVNEITYGNQAELIWSLILTYGYRLMIGIFVLMVGLILVVVSLIRYKTHFKGNVYVGYFLVMLALWVIAESRMIQLFTGNQATIGSLAYLMLALMPIPLAIFLKDYIFSKTQLRYLIYLFIVSFNTVMIVSLHALAILDFFESVAFSLLIIIIGFVMTLYTAINDFRKFQNPYAKTILNVFLFLSFFTILETINYFSGNFRQTSIFAITGIGILSLGLLINYMRYWVERLKLSYQSELYKKLAYTDQLTQGANRMAFEKDMDTFFEDAKTRKHMHLILFDLDDLKKINDVHGHLEGDEAIKTAFKSIQETFGHLGHCYRIGGDEFACIALNADESLITSYLKIYDEQLKRLTESLDYSFRISLGYATYHSADLKAGDLIKRADDAMYLNKCNYKGDCKRIKRTTS